MDAPGAVWDACGLLNLMATERPSEILTALNWPSGVVREVRTEEVLYLRPPPDEEPNVNLVEADLAPLIDQGLLTEIHLSLEEQDHFVTLASYIDDGEARTLSVAANRGLAVVTDDRAAMRVARGAGLNLEIITTPDWLMLWAEHSSLDVGELRDALRSIMLRGRYSPRRSHPLHEWWQRNSSE